MLLGIPLPSRNLERREFLYSSMRLLVGSAAILSPKEFELTGTMGNEMGNNHVIGIEAPVSDNPDAAEQINKSSDASVVSKDEDAVKATEQDDAEGVGTNESRNQQNLPNDADVPERMNQTSLSTEHDDRNEDNMGSPQDGPSAADDNQLQEKSSEERDPLEILSEEMMKEKEDLKVDEIIAIGKASEDATELLEHNETDGASSPFLSTLSGPALSVNEAMKEREEPNTTGKAAEEGSKQPDEGLGGQMKEVPDTNMHQIFPDCSKEEKEKQSTDECNKVNKDGLVDKPATNICSTVEISDCLNSSSELPAINGGSLTLASEVNIQNNLEDMMNPPFSQITAHKTEVSEFENNELGMNSVKRLYEFSSMGEESSQIPVKSDTSGSENVVPETDEDIRMYRINTSQEFIGTVSTQTTASLLETSKEESDKSPLLCQERPTTSEFSSLERSDSAKLRTPLLYAVVSLDEKEGILIEKSLIDACLPSASETMPASPRERGKKNPIYSFLCNCVCCGTAMD
ncbi:uncharacterized protein [Typha latifolia]|uniref:uncharacterized protein isoform X1 n=2 Tax=Typha latifolia TaxID=4733 RepID=UPI003C2F4412